MPASLIEGLPPNPTVSKLQNTGPLPLAMAIVFKEPPKSLNNPLVSGGGGLGGALAIYSAGYLIKQTTDFCSIIAKGGVHEWRPVRFLDLLSDQ